MFLRAIVLIGLCCLQSATLLGQAAKIGGSCSVPAIAGLSDLDTVKAQADPSALPLSGSLPLTDFKQSSSLLPSSALSDGDSTATADSGRSLPWAFIGDFHFAGTRQLPPELVRNIYDFRASDMLRQMMRECGAKAATAKVAIDRNRLVHCAVRKPGMLYWLDVLGNGVRPGTVGRRGRHILRLWQALHGARPEGEEVPWRQQRAALEELVQISSAAQKDEEPRDLLRWQAAAQIDNARLLAYAMQRMGRSARTMLRAATQGRNECERLPLYLAAKAGLAANVQLMVQQWLPRIGPVISRKHRTAALLCAGAEDRSLAVELLVRSGGADPNEPHLGMAPLPAAVWARHVRAARALLQLGAQPNRYFEGRQTPLSAAVVNNDIAMVCLLLEGGATARAVRCEKGLTLLKAAQRHGEAGREVLEALVEAQD